MDVILGVNGYIWVCLGSGDKVLEGNANSDGLENELVYSDKNDVSWHNHAWSRLELNNPLQVIPPPSRQAISRVCALIQIFARYSIPLTESLLMSGYDWCRRNNLEETGIVLTRPLEKQLLAEVVGIEDTDE